MELIKNYQENDRLRASLNRLTEATFGFDFEEWYQSGFWQGQYIPYSFVEDGEIVANVSVNKMDFVIDGELRHYIQLGTIMTAEPFRGQGLCRKLMERVRKDYQDCDGVFLFANDRAKDLYPKFGFRPAKEFVRMKSVQSQGECEFLPFDMEDEDNWIEMSAAIRQSVPNDKLWMKNLGLNMFYLTGIFNESVYYMPDEELYVVAELEDGVLTLHQMFAPFEVDIDAVVEAFGEGVTDVVLGFTPLSDEGFTLEELSEEDTTLFLLGDFHEFESGRWTFPTLSHA